MIQTFKIAVAIFSLTLSLSADPVQLVPYPTPAPAIVRLQPFIIDQTKMTTMLTGIASLQMAIMPAQYPLSTVRSITITPITSGSNIGKYALAITVAATSGTSQ